MKHFTTLQCPKEVFVDKKCAAVLYFYTYKFNTMMYEIFIPGHVQLAVDISNKSVKLGYITTVQ